MWSFDLHLKKDSTCVLSFLLLLPSCLDVRTYCKMLIAIKILLIDMQKNKEFKNANF